MFIPVNETHAIREVVFAVFFESAIPPSLVRAVGGNLLVPWRDYAPRRSELRALTIGAPLVTSMNRPFDGLHFEGFKRDGGLSWRVAMQGEAILINCLEYSGWETTWPLVREWLGWILAADPDVNVRSSGFGLQYINEFHCQDAEEQCAPAQFVAASDSVPLSLLAHKDPRWHLHHGWFNTGSDPYSGETLQRVHIDSARAGTPEEKQNITVVVDVFTRTHFAPAVPVRDDFDVGGKASQLFESLHELVKECLGEYVRDEILSQVKLRG